MLLKNINAKGFSPDNQKVILKKLQSANDQISRLGHLVNSLLDLSKIQTGHMKLELEELDLSSLIYEVMERLEPLLKVSGCEILYEIEKDLVVNANFLGLQRAIENILANAFKYAPGSKIKISTSAKSGETFIEISDNGPGMPKSKLSSIFNRYVRLISPNEVSGLSLGLYISKQIIEAHGGDIIVKSEEGVGTSFKISLP